MPVYASAALCLLFGAGSFFLLRAGKKRRAFLAPGIALGVFALAALFYVLLAALFVSAL